jgi:Do/DeqQ family serine protease
MGKMTKRSISTLALMLGFTNSFAVTSSAYAEDSNTSALPSAPVDIAAPSAGSRAVLSVAPIGPNTVADIAQTVAPSVVNIEVDKKTAQNAISIPDSSFFEFFFNGRRPDQNQMRELRPHLHTHDMGSGFIIRPDGYILTNAHVVQNGSKITVTLNDGRKFDSTVIGTDSWSDIAVLKVNADNLPIARMGSSKTLRPGEFVIAIGSPMGFDHTVTFGIVSAVGRSVRAVNDHVPFIQTDAAINFGNSGGPLLNLLGDVVGVNTAIQANAQNIGFSIPIDIVKDVVNDLINHRKIQRPYVGIAMQPLDETMTKSLGLPSTTKGVFVSEVYPESPAQIAGLEPGDIIEKVEGLDVDSAKAVQDLVRAHKVNETLHILVLRKNNLKALACNIGQYPNVASAQESDDDSNQP